MFSLFSWARFRAAAAKLGWEPVALRFGPGTDPSHGSHVALQPDHAHAARTAPHTPLFSRGDRGSDGLVPGKLARGGTLPLRSSLESHGSEQRGWSYVWFFPGPVNKERNIPIKKPKYIFQ